MAQENTVQSNGFVEGDGAPIQKISPKKTFLSVSTVWCFVYSDVINVWHFLFI